MQEQKREKQFEENVISIDRVSRVVKGGRRFRFRVLVAIGDGKQKVGVGSAKATDIQAAVAKAVDVAKKDMVTIPLYKSTIPHGIEVKRGGAHVMLKPATSGTGVIAGGVIRSVLDVTGVKDVLSKSLGSGNKINTAYATIEALRMLKPAKDWVTNIDKKPSKKDTAKQDASTTKAKKPSSKTVSKKPAKPSDKPKKSGSKSK